MQLTAKVVTAKADAAAQQAAEKPMAQRAVAANFMWADPHVSPTSPLYDLHRVPKPHLPELLARLDTPIVEWSAPRAVQDCWVPVPCYTTLARRRVRLSTFRLRFTALGPDCAPSALLRRERDCGWGGHQVRLAPAPCLAHDICLLSDLCSGRVTTYVVFLANVQT